jgi:hypothetical protein
LNPNDVFAMSTTETPKSTEVYKLEGGGCTLGYFADVADAIYFGTRFYGHLAWIAWRIPRLPEGETLSDSCRPGSPVRPESCNVAPEPKPLVRAYRESRAAAARTRSMLRRQQAKKGTSV